MATLPDLQLTEEERRAIAYRQQQMRRRQFEAARDELLAGNPLALFNVQLKLRPLMNEGTPISREISGLFMKVKK